jgi:C-terminal processing protease CtpA/Prc
MGRGESITKPTNLTKEEREQIFDRTAAKVTKEYFDPRYNGTDWPARASQRRDSIVAISDPDVFELEMHDLVRSLKTSHTGFFHQSVRRVPGRLAIGASFRRADFAGKPHWVAQDVHEAGPAHKAGLMPLDVLESINGSPIAPPEQPMFPMGTQVELKVRRGTDDCKLTVDIPSPRSRKQPYAEPRPVISKTLPNGVGYIKVTILPGILGLDVSRAIDAGFAALADCDCLVLDLRSHLGGGLGVLRLMSHLTPNKLPIGYTVTRRRAEAGYQKEELRKLDRLPTDLPNALGVATMALKYVGRDSSIALVSEGLGPKRWHGRVAILVNEHTVSAGEMVSAFAAENHLATIVGTETAGRLIPGSGFKVGHGYMLIMPKAEYLTWQGRKFEGSGIRPDVEVPWSPESFAAGVDNQLEAAINILQQPR